MSKHCHIHHFIIPLLIINLLLLAGCVTTPEKAGHLIVGVDQPLPYREGFAAGYDSSYAAKYPWFHFRKDVIRYGDDSLYRQGWDDGFRQAESEKDHPYFY